MHATLPVGDMNPRGRVDLLGGRLGHLPDGPRWRLCGDRLGTSGLGARGAATARGKGKNRGEPGHRRKSTVSHRATLTCCMCAKWCSRIRVDTSSRANVRRHSTSRSRSSVGERPPHTRKVAGSKPAGTTTEAQFKDGFRWGWCSLRRRDSRSSGPYPAKRFGSIRRVITEARRWHRVPRRCRPVRRRRVTASNHANVTIWKRCGAAWRVVDVSCR
jgi:hypothetical protein